MPRRRKSTVAVPRRGVLVELLSADEQAGVGGVGRDYTARRVASLVVSRGSTAKDMAITVAHDGTVFIVKSFGHISDDSGLKSRMYLFSSAKVSSSLIYGLGIENGYEARGRGRKTYSKLQPDQLVI
jgi:hypothetical protein